MEVRRSLQEVLVFSIKWLNNNLAIGAVFLVLVVINSWLIANGHYG